MTNIKMTDAMIDIETLGTVAGCPIASIGIVAFNPVYGIVGESVHIAMDLISQAKLGMNVSIETILWWMKQSEGARNSTFFAPNQVTLGQGLYETTLFFQKHGLNKVWAQGPHFDITILEEGYRRVNKSPPWTYRMPRDTRTVFELAQVKSWDYMKGDAHNAEDDALAQSYALCDAFRKLGLSKSVEDYILEQGDASV